MREHLGWTSPTCPAVSLQENYEVLGLTTSSSSHSRQENCEVLARFDKGGFGRIFLAKHWGTGMLVAVKELVKAKEPAFYIVSEVQILKDLQHPNIVQLLEVIETFHKVYLVLEYQQREAMLEGSEEEQQRLPDSPVLRLPATLRAPPKQGGPNDSFTSLPGRLASEGDQSHGACVGIRTPTPLISVSTRVLPSFQTAVIRSGLEGYGEPKYSRGSVSTC
ncbi:MAP/microtubule affinity-regulating kinase 4 [Heterocephalus glaber]|uniref:non-specific serine/threonine protein kinase n=1 Tax=Heterocephalus glaber TaxID=10181 RepID=G5BII8_HETGA|nr:MAP/microtubule affinity-regulating kinase 4 [Heterocephalus glaber]